MPTIFLSHTSIDKPFVEKLARDLEQLGISVWYDKYEIRVGESILWKIDEGIRESEFLGIVISRQAWESEWVKTEISSAWQKQAQQKGNFVLPIYYRECEIPLFLRGIKYADFRTDYQSGLKDLVRVFGIKELDVITEDNWRRFARKRDGSWKEFRDREFERLVTKTCHIARTYNFYVWVGASKSPYSFVISGWISRDSQLSVAVRMDPAKNYRYMAADTREWNPNNVARECYQRDIGGTVNEVEEYLTGIVERFVENHGRPRGKNHLFTEKSMDVTAAVNGVMEVMKKSNWDQGAHSQGKLSL